MTDELSNSVSESLSFCVHICLLVKGDTTRHLYTAEFSQLCACTKFCVNTQNSIKETLNAHICGSMPLFLCKDCLSFFSIWYQAPSRPISNYQLPVLKEEFMIWEDKMDNYIHWTLKSNWHEIDLKLQIIFCGFPFLNNYRTCALIWQSKI